LIALFVDNHEVGHTLGAERANPMTERGDLRTETYKGGNCNLAQRVFNTLTDERKTTKSIHVGW